ncbi:MAG: agmatine deiminase [Gammaproteobacteria bacterium]|nr:agmatine deiminase [Gammaproteobacteria bacterium]
MAVPLSTTPRADGFAMPAEWAPQAACWMAWPERPDTWRLNSKPAQIAFATVANLVAEHEAVTVCVSYQQFALARRMLSSAVRVVEITTNDAWMRDIGPTFVRDARHEVRAVDWAFNAWGGHRGGLYSPWDADDQVASKIAEIEGVARYRAPFVMEGGAIHVDGEGTCLTTEQCLLNPNRNPDLTRIELENALCEYLGVETVVWLSEGIYNDETDGHVDNLCCFLRPGVVALATCTNPADPQYRISADARARLKAARDARGRVLEVVEIPVPQTPLSMTAAESNGIERAEGAQPRTAGTRLAASYINFLLVNGGVIVPQFNDPHDARAVAILEEQFPGRKVHLVSSREILLGGGNVHCITQQQPAKRA